MSMCNFRDIFLLLWSLGSGYGIIFACESFAYECLGINLQIMFLVKGLLAVFIGFIIGGIHFYYTKPDPVDKLDDNDTTTNVSLSPSRKNSHQEGIQRQTRMCYMCNKNNVLSDEHSICKYCFLKKKEKEEQFKRLRTLKSDKNSNKGKYMQVVVMNDDDETSDEEKNIMEENEKDIIMETSLVRERSM
eukprot:101780_1